jgi:DNA-binding beta-propeller fold protein YncE
MKRKCFLFVAGFVFVSAIAPAQNLYVSNYGGSNVTVYDGGTGASLGAFVPAGSGGLTNPGNLIFSKRNGNLLVASYNSSQVLKYDGNTGTSLGVFAPLAAVA